MNTDMIIILRFETGREAVNNTRTEDHVRKLLFLENSSFNYIGI